MFNIICALTVFNRKTVTPFALLNGVNGRAIL